MFPPPISPKRILIVEDDLLLAKTIQRVLAVDGHQVDVAQNGEQALTMFKVGDHDLIIADFVLPQMDGLDLAEAIKARSPAKPIILITAYAEWIEPGMGKVSNVDAIMKKPFFVAQLQEAMVKVFPAQEDLAIPRASSDINVLSSVKQQRSRPRRRN